jgi:AcrR family transcriptional regulator
MGAPKGDRAAVTQQQLVDAARQVFEVKGYQATSVAAITEAAGTAHGTFYLYFKNKEDAFAQLIGGVLDELYEQTLTELDPAAHAYDPTVARERVAAFLRVAEAQGRLWRALLEAILESDAVQATWLAARARFHEGLAARLRIYRARGQLRDLDPDLTAAALAGMLEWLVFTSASFDVPGPLRVDDRLIDTVADLWAAAIDVGGAAGA